MRKARKLTPKQFGKLVRMRRTKMQLTQSQVGSLLGHASGQIISNVERGLSVGPRTRKQVCSVLRMRVNI